MADPHRRCRRLVRGPVGRAAGLLIALSPVLAAPTHALAKSDEDVEHYDARVQGYDPDAESKSSSVAMQWIMLFLLGGVCVGVMFINANRSHLD